jgi:glycosyltransferase involved in cell wall biosynthesis
MFRMFQDQSTRHNRLSQFQSILVASTHMREEFEAHGVRAERLHLVPLPTIVSQAFVPPAARTPANRILFAGRLTDIKGGQFLVPATKKASEALRRPLTLVIAGEGPERQKLSALARKLAVQAEFTGWLDYERTLSLMRTSDLLAVPSIWPEPFGLVGVEAGALSKPAVAYSVGGVRSWLTAGETGEIAPGDPPTVDGLADAIVRALGNPEHYSRLCRGAWQSARTYTLGRHMEQLEGILAQAVCPVSPRTPAPQHAVKD